MFPCVTIRAVTQLAKRYGRLYANVDVGIFGAVLNRFYLRRNISHRFSKQFMNVGKLIYNLICRMCIERIVRRFLYEGTHTHEEKNRSEKNGEEKLLSSIFFNADLYESFVNRSKRDNDIGEIRSVSDGRFPFSLVE